MTTIVLFILIFSANENPPHTIKVKNHFVDKTEILNIHWLEYMHIKGRELDSIQRKRLAPDSSNYWYAGSDHRNEPIVLITYEQALDYCAWRSKVVSEKFGRKITYRLPTPAEWKDIAGEIIKTDLKQVEKELAETKKRTRKDATQYYMTKTENPEPRIYHLFDNVSEMTLEIGIAMGANNLELPDLEANLTRVIQYTTQDAYLGFRCVAETE